jgi:hypothetical protein
MEERVERRRMQRLHHKEFFRGNEGRNRKQVLSRKRIIVGSDCVQKPVVGSEKKHVNKFIFITEEKST